MIDPGVSDADSGALTFRLPHGQAILPVALEIVEYLCSEFGAEVTEVDLNPTGTEGTFVFRVRPARHPPPAPAGGDGQAGEASEVPQP